MARSIVYTADLPAAVERALDERFDARKVLLQRVGAEAFLRALGDVRAVVTIPGDPFDARLIAALPASVGLIASYSTGVDHVDLAAAHARGIRITNTPDVLTDATADAAMLLILGTLRGAASAMRLIQEDRWEGWRPAAVFGVDLKGRVLGIAGGGRIGCATAARARAFGMELAYWGRSVSAGMDALGARYERDWLAFLGGVDVVSLHLPSTAETRGLVGARALGAMRPGSYLVNTARGDLLDDEAVLAALASGRLAGVGLDVFRGEPAIHPGYREVGNAFLLPHIGSATEETRAAMGASVLASLEAFFGG